MTDAATSCRLCTLTRAAWRVVRLVMLPRTLAFIGAVVVLAAMAPTSMPPSTITAAPKAASVPAVASSGALAASAAATGGAVAAASAARAAAALAAAAAASSIAAASAAADAAAALAGAASRPGATGPRPTARQSDARAEKPLAGPGPAASAAAAGESDGAVRFRDVAMLPPARVGVPWRHQMLAGAPPYVMQFVGERPAWLVEFEAGTLAGTPPRAQTYTFTLQGAAAGDARTVTQTFSVLVRPALAAPPAARSEPQVLSRLSAEELDAEPPTERDIPFTWRLDDADFKELASPPAKVPRDTTGEFAAEPPPSQRPSDKQWRDMLGPLTGVDYPTEAHFRKVLRLAHCTYFRGLLKHAAKERTKQGPGRTEEPDPYECPQRPAAAGAGAMPGGAASPPAPGKPRANAAKGAAAPPKYPKLDEDFFALMPSEDRVVKVARKLHRPSTSFRPLWLAQDGCGCVPPARGEEVYGFVSYWGTAEQGATRMPTPTGAGDAVAGEDIDPPKEARHTDFSLFSRLSFFGAMLNDFAAYDMPLEVSAQAQALAHAAQRHGTQVDLVLHRNDWDLLARRTDAQLQAFAQRAAENAMPLLNQPHKKLGFGQSLLLPFWREENMPFSGLTVFFDNLPAPDSDAAPKFRAFHRAFILSLIKQMQIEQLSGRRRGAYRLNIVVPDHQVAEEAKDGLFTFADMKSFIEQAEPKRPGKKVDAAERTWNVGTTDITLDYIVLLSDLTTDTKKALRARLDRSSNVTGVRRVVLLESLLPALLRPTAVRAAWGPDAPAAQFRDDLAYMKWSFGGVTLWELPNTSAADRPLMEHLGAQFRLDNRRWPALCNFVCPNRIVFRLLLQALVAVSATAIALWFLNCAVRNLGRPYLAFLWSAVLCTAVLVLMLLECDPALSAWSGSNWLLIAPLVLLLAVGLVLSFRSRRARP